MSNNILGLRTTIYKVGDMLAGKKWYTDVFETEPYFDEPFYAGFNVGGYELGLQPTEDTAANAANVVSYWGVDDVPSAYARLLELGATTFDAPREVGGGIIVAVVKDPWGNAVGLIHNPHFSL